jgi:hypothetical protein
MPVDRCICGEVHDYSKTGLPPNDYDNPHQYQPEPHTPRVATQESSQQYRAKQRTQDRHQARSLKYGATC